MTRSAPATVPGETATEGDAPHVTEPEAEVLVRAEGVTVTYEPTPRWLQLFVKSAVREPVHALTDVDLVLRRGEIVAVVGPNGAGKSTLFRAVTGLLTPTRGTVHVFGMHANRLAPDAKRLVSFMPPDDRTLFHRQTCRENMEFRARLLGMSGSRLSEAVDANLELVGLSHAAGRSVVALSSGMRYRLMLARALLGDPEVLVLDEPTGPLDPMAAHDLIALLVALVAERGIGAFVSSHRMDDVESMPQRVVLIDRGRIRFDGSVETLHQRAHRSRLEIRATTARTAASIREQLEARGVDADLDGTAVHVASDLPVGQLLAGLAGLDHVVGVDHHRAGLREVMTEVVREEAP